MTIDLTELVAPRHTALVLQEVQNGVVGADGVLPELAAAAAATDLVAHCAQLATAARAAAVPVFHCTAEHRADGKGGNRNARLFAGVKRSRVELASGSDAVQPPAVVGVDPGDIVLPRFHGLGPMSGTQLDPMLRNLGVSTIVGVGVSLNIGVTNLCFDAVNLGYQVVIPTDAVAGVPSGHAQSMLDHTLALLATLVTTAEVLDAWVAAPGSANGSTS